MARGSSSKPEFPAARVVTCENHGFGHANNRGLLTTNARYVLFLNPDTEIREGSFAELLARLDSAPRVGVAGVKQLLPNGTLYPTIRRFPNAVRAFWQALASEKYPLRAPWLGERELDMARYEREVDCDWTSGSFLIARREALESSGYFDERFFLFSEETDLCLRIKKAGWDIRHVPIMTIVHHAQKAGANPRLAAQDALGRRQYASKHFSPAHRFAYFGALAIGYGVRAVAPGGDPVASAGRRSDARAALSMLVRGGAAPFAIPPAVALRPRQNGHSTEPARPEVGAAGGSALSAERR